MSNPTIQPTASSAKDSTLGPVLHAGIERAASTFLQDVAFPSVHGYHYRPDLTQALIKIGLAHYEQLEPWVSSNLTEARNMKVILSTEGFLCNRHAFTGKIERDPILSLINARALLGDNLRLILVIRRQDAAINSMIQYKQRYLADPKMYLVDWPVRRTLTGASWIFESLTGRLLESYNYYRWLVAAAGILGKNKLHVLLYEELKSAPDKFFSELGSVFGTNLSELTKKSQCRLNVTSEKYDRLPGKYVPMPHAVRRFNNLTGYRLENILPSREHGLRANHCKEILDIFRADNRRLANFLGLELQRYGYF